MAKRIIKETIKNSEGDILFLCNPSEVWSPRPVEKIIIDIENSIHSYIVKSSNSPETPIHVVNGPRKKYLRSDPDTTQNNNLDQLDNETALPPLFLGNYPDKKDSDWSEDLQGVAHSAEYWFFTQLKKILKFHVSTDIDSNSKNASLVVDMPKELEDFGCNHFGDPDYTIIMGIGYLFIPVEGSGDCKKQPRIAVFRDDEQLTYIGSSTLPNQTESNQTPRAGWCAISPINGLLHSSHNIISPQFPVFRYHINNYELVHNQNVELSPRDDLILTKDTSPLTIHKYIQGGCFSPGGFLFICNGRLGLFEDHNENLGGIRAFNHYGEFLYRSSIHSKPFKYEYHTGTARPHQEPEGLTYWNLDSSSGGISSPNIAGQLHGILLNKSFLKNEYWFKHYRFNTLI